MEMEHYLTFTFTSNTDCNGDLTVSEPYIIHGKQPKKDFYSVREILDSEGNINGLLPPKLVERLEAERKEQRRQEEAERAADRRFEDEMEAMHEARG